MCAPCKPTFEVGKTYRTRDGRKVTIESTTAAQTLATSGGAKYAQPLRGKLQGSIGSYNWCADGRFGPPAHSPDACTHPADLMPGAIEDEKQATIRHADLIRAVLDGKVVQMKAPGGTAFNDLAGDDRVKVSTIVNYTDCEFRLKPETLVRWVPMTEAGHVYGGHGERKAAVEAALRMRATRLVRLEVDPVSKQVVGTKTEEV